MIYWSIFLLLITGHRCHRSSTRQKNCWVYIIYKQHFSVSSSQCIKLFCTGYNNTLLGQL